jgi:hypothetical protein
MNQSTPISDLPGNMDVELESDSNMVDDILQELQMQPEDTLLPPPKPSDAVHASVYQPLQPTQPTAQQEKAPLDKTYERFVWLVEHMKVPAIVVVLYLLTHNSSMVSQLQTVLPTAIVDPFSIGHLILKGLTLAVLVEVCRTLWD